MSKTFLKASFVALAIVGVFVVLSIWVPLIAVFGALAIISFVGGAILGKLGVVLSPIVVALIAIVDELTRRHPLHRGTFFHGGVALILVVTLIAYAGCKVRPLARRGLTGLRGSKSEA